MFEITIYCNYSPQIRTFEKQTDALEFCMIQEDLERGYAIQLRDTVTQKRISGEAFRNMLSAYRHEREKKSLYKPSIQ